MHRINRVPWICGQGTLYSCSGGSVFTAAAAGRVQSVALRLVAEREAEIEAHVPREYWSVAARLRAPNERTFYARLTQARLHLEHVMTRHCICFGPAPHRVSAAAPAHGSFAHNSTFHIKQCMRMCTVLPFVCKSRASASAAACACAELVRRRDGPGLLQRSAPEPASARRAWRRRRRARLWSSCRLRRSYRRALDMVMFIFSSFSVAGKQKVLCTP